MKKHNWFDDTCTVCGIMRRTRTVYTKDMRMKKTVYDYYFNNEWQMIRPECDKKKY